MGLLNMFFEEFIEVIDWVEKGSNTIMWKFPDKDANIKSGAQLTVRESQAALFVDEGQIVDLFEPGRHELFTENLPLLTTLRSWETGFKSPFKCDVYFFSKRTFTDLKWGTSSPIILRDPEFKQVRIKAHGKYFLKLSDPIKFFKEYGGTKSEVKISEIESSLRDIVTPKFAEALAESGVSVMDMVSNYSEIGDKIIPTLSPLFADFGLELVKFQISSTSLPKEVEAFYDKMTNMSMVDDMSKFSQFQQAQAIEKAAENPGGGAGEGIGMGMGFGMANMMMNNQANMNSGQNQPEQKQDSKEDVMNLLKDLGQLKESGVLTQKEFDTKKKELLARL